MTIGYLVLLLTLSILKGSEQLSQTLQVID